MLVLGLSLLALTTGAADTPRSVTDYYQQLPEALFFGGEKYALTRSKEGWVTHSTRTDSEIAVTVDVKNGFIQFTDEGTGGGDRKLQVALFLKEDKTPLMAVSQSDFDGVVFSGGVVFAEPTGDQWKPVNDRVLPRLRPEDFLKPRCLDALEPQAKDRLVNESLAYTLPRQGTTLLTTVKVLRSMLKEEFQDGESPCPKENTLMLKWDKKAGRFTR